MLYELGSMTTYYQKIIDLLYIIPKDVCNIIKQYCDDYKTCEYLDKYDIVLGSSACSGCLFDGKIYMGEYYIIDKGKLVIYDIEKKITIKKNIGHTRILRIDIYNNKLYILSILNKIFCYNLDLNCQPKITNFENDIRCFVIRDKCYHTYYDSYGIYVHDGKKITKFCETVSLREVIYIHDDYLYKTNTYPEFISVGKIHLKNKKETEILLQYSDNINEMEIFFKKLIISDFNIYLLTTRNFYCYNLFGELNYKININNFPNDKLDKPPKYFIDILIHMQNIYFIINDGIVTLRQR